MSCSICGKKNCDSSLHAADEKELYDDRRQYIEKLQDIIEKQKLQKNEKHKHEE